MKHPATSFSATSELVNTFTGRPCRQNNAKITTDNVGPGSQDIATCEVSLGKSVAVCFKNHKICIKE